MFQIFEGRAFTFSTLEQSAHFRQEILHSLIMAPSRRPRSTIDSVVLFNEKDDEGSWVPRKYTRNAWVLMHPSSKGTFRKSKKTKFSFRSYWKAKIIDFKTSAGGKSISEILVQHVYMHSEINVQGINSQDHKKCNCEYGYIIFVVCFLFRIIIL